MKDRRLGSSEAPVSVDGIRTWHFGGEWGRDDEAGEEVPGGVDMATWTLAWCLQHPAVCCVIPGCKNVEQVGANAKEADR